MARPEHVVVPVVDAPDVTTVIGWPPNSRPPGGSRAGSCRGLPAHGVHCPNTCPPAPHPTGGCPNCLPVLPRAAGCDRSASFAPRYCPIGSENVSWPAKTPPRHQRTRPAAGPAACPPRRRSPRR
ncbi:hypothetical protein CU254_38750 [Amycolatopsis sp. AA4]|nr:hypothetical protein CU254_38750 [Amycolatopsis sp. AA4]